MQREFGKSLPPGCKVDVSGTTTDGVHIELKYTTPA
jgi:hypothetical protein